MRSKGLVWSGVIAVAVMSGSQVAGVGKPGANAATSRLFDIVSSGAPATLRSDSFVSGQQTYTDGADSVVSKVAGDWDLNTRNSSVRAVYVDFTSAVGLFQAPFTAGLVAGRWETLCQENPMRSLESLGLAEEIVCPVRLTFTHNKANYSVRMNADKWSGTDSARVACTAVSGTTGACTAWSIDPTGADGTNIARLIRIDSARGTQTLVELGDYRMTFHFEAKRP